MATLQSMLILTLRDQVSGNASRISAALGRISDVGTRTARHLNRGQTSLIAGLNLSTGNLKQSYYDWDNLGNQIQAITEASDQKMGALKGTIDGVSASIGVMPQELFEAAKAWIELGNSIDSYSKNAEVAAKVSRITGIPVKEQMKETSALMRAYGFSMDDADAYKHFEEVYLVASKGMLGGAPAFGEAMKNAAPAAKAAGLSLEETAALVQTLGGQFNAGEIGTAIKTILPRLQSPRSKALGMLEASGIDITSLFRLDGDRIKTEASKSFGNLVGFIAGDVNQQTQAALDKAFAGTDVSNGAKPLEKRINAILLDAYGKETLGGNKVFPPGMAKEFRYATAQMLAMYSNGLNLNSVLQTLGDQAGHLREDEFRSGGAAALIKELTPALGELSPALQESFRQAFANADLQKNGYLLREKLKALIQQDFGSDLAPAGVNAVFTSLSKVWDSFSTGANVPLLDALGGLQRYSVFLDVLRQHAHVNERIQHNSEMSPGAIERKWAIFDNDGFARATDHLAANWDAFWKKLGDGAVGKDAAFLVESLANLIKSLDNVDPTAQRFAFWGIAVAGGLGTVRAALALILGPLARFVGLAGALPAAAELAGAATGAGGLAALAAGGGAAAVAKRGMIGRLFRSKWTWIALLGAAAAEYMNDADASEVGGKPPATGTAKAPAPPTWKDKIVKSLLSDNGGYTPLSPAEAAEIKAMQEKDKGSWWHRLWASHASAPAPSPGATAVAAGNAVATGRDGAAEKTTADLSGLETQAQGSVSAISSAMAQVQAIVAAVDLTAQGRRIAETLAAGIRSGTSSIAAAAQAAADAATHAAVRDSLADGGLR